MATKPFYGDPTSSAPVSQKYAVLLGGLAATIPTGTPTGATVDNRGFILNDPEAATPVTTEWDPVGSLDDTNPMDDGEEAIEVTNHSAAGFGVYAKTYKNQEERLTFTALEETLVTLGILYDASGVTDSAGVLSGTLKQRDPSEKFLLGLVKENATEMIRKVSSNYCQIESISRAFGDGKPARTVTVAVYPTVDKELFEYYRGPLS